MDFRTRGAEIGRAANAPVRDGLFPDFLITDEDFAATENFVIGSDEISKSTAVSASPEILIGDEEIESASCG